MTTAAKKNGAGVPRMPCPFCDQPAKVKLCKPSANKTAPEGVQVWWYWQCECQARGFIPDSHYRQLDKAKKISFN